MKPLTGSRLLLLILACLGTSAIRAQSIIYVDDTATGANNGSAWCDAYNYLQDALVSAGSFTEIRVAQGTYIPDQDTATPGGSGDRAATFDLLGDLSLRGGYAGCAAPYPDARDVERYETILSGDLSGDDGSDFLNYDENSYHVLTVNDAVGSIALDGFTVSGGNANGIFQDATDRGGGMHLVAGNPSLNDCTFIRNRCSSDTGLGSGGAFSTLSGSPSITNCVFIENRADGTYSEGGAVSAYQGRFADSVFVSNSASGPGGAFSGGGTVSGCIFVDNHSQSQGGGIHSFASFNLFISDILAGNTAPYGGGLADHDSGPKLVNSLFVGNSASTEGGGATISDDFSLLTVINCTFAENQTDTRGAGLVVNPFAGIAVVTGGIFWGNQDNVGQDEYAQIYPVDDPSGVTINYSSVQDWSGVFGGVGNQGDAPLFVGGPSGSWTADATRDGKPGQTTLYDGNATFVDDELVGKFLNPNISQALQTVVVANTATEITVWGNYTSLGTTGASYQLNDYHLLPGSPCVDAADNSAMLPDTPDLDADGNTTEPLPWDLDGNPRFSDDLCTVDTGYGEPPIIDMGAYEFQNGSVETAIGDRVWVDFDGNGIQDNGEPGMGSVLVYLYDEMGLLQDFAFTDASGNYEFSGAFWSSEYSVRFIPSPGYSLTDQHQGVDDQLDSDADPITGFTAYFRVCDEVDATRWDAGMLPLLPCLSPDEPIYLYAMTLDDNQHPVLHFMDPNQPTQVTGYNVYRSPNASVPKQQWPKVASDVVDMDEAIPNKQWVDSSDQEPPPPASVWYYQVTAYNGPPCDAEGPFGWPLEHNCDNGLDDDLDTLVDCDDPDCSTACDPLPIELGDTWSYFKGTQEPTPYDPAVAEWAQPGFNDSSWPEGASGFGYGTDCASLHNTELSDMQDGYVSVYIRIPFHVEDPSVVTGLTLTVDYDDGWVGYLNGTEVTRSPGMGGTPGVPPRYDQLTQTGDHECSGAPGGANPAEEFDLSGSIGLLVPGTNVLALQGHNRASISSDFSLIPELSSTVSSP